jgi:hypothetical protein
MKPVTKVKIVWFTMVGSSSSVEAADPLNGEMAALTARFSHELRENPKGFVSQATFQGYATTRFIFRPLCATAAMLAFPSHANPQAPPDAICVLLNGVETPQDMQVVKAAVNLPPQHWERLEQLEKPLTAAAFNVNNRMRDPATTSLIHAIGNVYFNMFGTNAVDQEAA